jgi:hypothetical protein
MTVASMVDTKFLLDSFHDFYYNPGLGGSRERAVGGGPAGTRATPAIANDPFVLSGSR